MTAVVKDYLTPAPSDDAIRKALLVGRHLITLNRSGCRFEVKTPTISDRGHGARGRLSGDRLGKLE